MSLQVLIKNIAELPVSQQQLVIAAKRTFSFTVYNRDVDIDLIAGLRTFGCTGERSICVKTAVNFRIDIFIRNRIN